MYHLKSYQNTIEGKWNERSCTQPEEIKDVLRAMTTKIRTTQSPFIAFIALILYDIFILKTSLEEISKKYDVPPKELKRLRNETQIYADKVMAFSESFDWSKHFIGCIKSFTGHIEEVFRSSIRKERKRLAGVTNSIEMPTSTKMKMNDVIQQDKENKIEGKNGDQIKYS